MHEEHMVTKLNLQLSCFLTLHRFVVIERCSKGIITNKHASILLGVPTATTCGMIRRLRCKGVKGIIARGQWEKYRHYLEFENRFNNKENNDGK